MPEPSVLPAGRALHPVPLPDGALEDIRARARRRRTGRAAALGSAGLTAAVLVTASVATGGLEQRDDSLRIVPATPVLPALVAPSPQATADRTPVADRAQAPAPGVPAAPAAAGHAPEAYGSQPRAVAAVVPRASNEPAEEPGSENKKRRYDPDAVRSDTTIITLVPECEQTGRGSVNGWCLAMVPDTTNQRLLLSACRARGYGGGRLDWATSQQVRFEVRDSARDVVWTYSPRVRPEPSSADVPAEQCLAWEVPWRAVDEDGEALPDGQYTARGASTAASLRTASTESTFTVGHQDPVGGPPPACGTQVREAPIPSIC